MLFILQTLALNTRSTSKITISSYRLHIYFSVVCNSLQSRIYTNPPHPPKKPRTLRRQYIYLAIPSKNRLSRGIWAHEIRPEFMSSPNMCVQYSVPRQQPLTHSSLLYPYTALPAAKCKKSASSFTTHFDIFIWQITNIFDTFPRRCRCRSRTRTKNLRLAHLLAAATHRAQSRVLIRWSYVLYSRRIVENL